MVHQVARPKALAQIPAPLELVDRGRSDLPDHRRDVEVALELYGAVLDGPGGEQRGRQGAFVVEHPLAVDQVAFHPSPDVFGQELAGAPDVVGRSVLGVDVGVEDQALSPAGPFQDGHDVVASGRRLHLAGREALIGQPPEQGLAHLPLEARGAADVSEAQGDFRKLFAINGRKDGVNIHVAASPAGFSGISSQYGFFRSIFRAGSVSRRFGSNVIKRLR